MAAPWEEGGVDVVCNLIVVGSQEREGAIRRARVAGLWGVNALDLLFAAGHEAHTHTRILFCFQGHCCCCCCSLRKNGTRETLFPLFPEILS